MNAVPECCVRQDHAIGKMHVIYVESVGAYPMLRTHSQSVKLFIRLWLRNRRCSLGSASSSVT